MNAIADSTETAAPPRQTVTAYELMGGAEGLRRLVDRFYRVMDIAPEAAAIRAMHGEDLAPVATLLYEWMSGWLGGPALFIQRKGSPCIVGAHARFAIGPAERDQWLWCMSRALDEVDADPRLRKVLEPALARLADGFRHH